MLEYELNIKEQKMFCEQISVMLSDKENVIKLKNEELALLADKLFSSNTNPPKMVKEFDIAKIKIKNLTGIKLTVIAKLKEKLGNQ